MLLLGIKRFGSIVEIILVLSREHYNRRL